MSPCFRKALAGLIVAMPITAAAGEQFPEGFLDCDTCPEMVAISAGTFLMGSPPDETGHSSDEGPTRTVTIAGDIAVGRYEVTRAEYSAFVEDTGRALIPGCHVDETGDWEFQPDRSWRDPGYSQGDRHPVVCVSWNDARAYTAWLSAKTGRAYRLLSEAEWEYAARAGTATAGFWGNNSALACDFANVHDQTSKTETGLSWGPYPCEDGIARTAAVGLFRANAFGLHDTLGNAWEWTEDCWFEDHPAGAPTDGSARIGDPCNSRVLRGGSWYYGPVFVRAAERTGVDPDVRIFDVGFRVARKLN